MPSRLTPPAHADNIQPNGLGGFKIYDNRGRLVEHIIPNAGDWYDRWALDGERIGIIEPAPLGIYEERMDGGAPDDLLLPEYDLFAPEY